VAVSPPPVKLETPPAPPAFDFGDEATAVIAPDRARELLDAEAKRSASSATEGSSESETPLGFGFDDEATQVLDTDRAHALLNAPSQPPPAEHPGGGEKPKGAEAATPGAFPSPASDARRSKPDEPTDLPTVMVTAPAPKGAKAEPAPAKPSAPPSSRPAADRDLIALSNEPTRVVRVKKKGPGPGLYLLVFLALVAAAAGGFIASELLPRSAKPPSTGAP